jgi:hypothetical protein
MQNNAMKRSTPPVFNGSPEGVEGQTIGITGGRNIE